MKINNKKTLKIQKLKLIQKAYIKTKTMYKT
jgi:hypothetical protein